MNKFRVLPIIGAAALTMGFASCSNDDVPAPVADRLTFEVTVPSDVATRTFSDGLNATELQVALYDASKTNAAPVISTFGTGIHEEMVTITSTGPRTFKVSVPLAYDVNYNVVFWADAYGDGANSPYTFDGPAQSISVNYEKINMNENKPDAFYAYVKTISGAQSNTTSVTLNRAMAQVNVGALDYEVYKQISTKELAQSSYTLSSVPSVLNLSAGTVSSYSENVTLTAETLPVLQNPEEFFPLGRKDAVTEEIPDAPAYLAMAYVLAGKSEYLIPEFTYNFGTANKIDIVSNTFQNIPVRGNYRTNIYGNLLTTMVTFNVEIDPMFKGTVNICPANNAANLTAALENVADGGTVMITENIANAGRINVPKGKTVTIDLNGKTISDVCFVARTGSNVTFTGEGTVNGGPALAAVTAVASTVNIENGNFTAGIDANGKSNSCIFSEQGGIVNISGGEFRCQKAAAENPNWYYVLNRWNGSDGYFSVTGGTFYNYNPAEGDDHDTTGSWVADGYTVEQNGDAYTVVKE